MSEPLVEGTAADIRGYQELGAGWTEVRGEPFVALPKAELDALVAEREALQRENEQMRLELSETGECRMLCTPEAQGRVGVLEAALRDAASKLAWTEATRWVPFNGEKPDLSIGEIADAWYALLIEQSSGAVLAGGETDV